MKIIEPGPDFREPWAYVTECHGCQTKVEVEIYDVKRGYEGGAWSERGDFCLYWECPFCGTQPNLPKTMWKVVQRQRPELKP